MHADRKCLPHGTIFRQIREGDRLGRTLDYVRRRTPCANREALGVIPYMTLTSAAKVDRVLTQSGEQPRVYCPILVECVASFFNIHSSIKPLSVCSIRGEIVRDGARFSHEPDRVTETLHAWLRFASGDKHFPRKADMTCPLIREQNTGRLSKSGRTLCHAALLASRTGSSPSQLTQIEQ
ncbi:hypothetical protein BU26DRAFT_65725 [Trematosphaeria pertusa]|uniref:Uncharacterized protein n=1 Tax=Trematosphaeria pertusa TaxID=390896 RepID=A0A6A6I704_9PLEO|nr:uncharacterized protein BU26DRAFT_65725 [Trematosphaeria pertusa]KAF2246305.1 hypothetical protein BU26DRAFT_65725 [Trematosphaeria pertusa]